MLYHVKKVDLKNYTSIEVIVTTISWIRSKK